MTPALLAIDASIIIFGSLIYFALIRIADAIRDHK